MCIVSIIVPVYNTASFLKECFDSLLKQTLKDIEIIVVDDGSTDDSAIIAERYQQMDARVKLFRQENQGVGVARNAGLDIACGEYIAFVDSDDWVVPKAYERLVNAGKEYQVDMVMGNVMFCLENGTRFDRYKRKDETIFEQPLSGRDCFVRLNEQNAFSPMVVTYLYRREFIEANKFRFVNTMHEDELWTPMAMCKAMSVRVVGFNFYAYRQRYGSIMNTKNSLKRLLALKTVADKLADFSDDICSDSKDCELKNWLYMKVFWLYRYAFLQVEDLELSRLTQQN